MSERKRERNTLRPRPSTGAAKTARPICDKALVTSDDEGQATSDEEGWTSDND